MIVVISWTEWLKDVQLRRMAEATNAAAYVDRLPNDRTAFVFDTDRAEWLVEQWSRYSKSQMVHIFNAIGGSKVNFFANRDDAQRRVALKIISAARECELFTFNPPATLSDKNAHERQMLWEADAFYACAFRGHPKGYDKVECKTLPEARKAARSIYQDRPVGIYAVRAGRQTHIENYDPNEEKTEMAREAKIGDFKPVGRNTHIGKIIAEYQNGTTNVDDIAILVGLSTEQAVGHLRAARGTNGIGHKVEKETRELTISIPEGVEVFKAAKEPKTSVPKEPSDRTLSPRVVGDFKQVRGGSSLAKIIESAAKGGRTMAAIAEEAGIREDQASHRLRHVLGVNHGIDYTKDASGVITLVPPAGRSLDDLIARKEPEQQAAE